jgi:hypothetical protein
MLQDMDDVEASCDFYVKIGTFTHLAPSQISLLASNKMGIVWLTAQNHMIVSISLMEYPGDDL